MMEKIGSNYFTYSMKKHRPGFVPVRFKKAGMVLLALGIALLLDWLIGFLTGWFIVDMILPFVGVILLLVGLYLVFVVPKE